MNQVFIWMKAEEKAIDYVFGLLDIPWLYYAIAAFLGVAGWQLWKKPSLGLLIGYAFLILAETVLIRKPFTGEHIKLELFWSWKQWNVQKEQILTNVVMFIPIGALAGWLWKWKGLWFAAGLSLLVEVLQLATSRGLLEFDDVFHNLVGAAFGIGIVVLMAQINEKFHE
jgi:glycopeptide antibiotics resistance protein